MRERVSQEMVLGAFALLFGLFVVFLWAPFDSDTGIVEKVRGRFSIGDALAPTVAGYFIALSGAFIFLGGCLRAGETNMSLANLRFIGTFIAIVAASMIVMRFLGPLVADLLGYDYRVLRDAVPWKYIGFVIGGGGMIFGLMSLAEGQVRMSRLVLALAIAGGMALIYDLPFEDLLMPPNGDV